MSHEQASFAVQVLDPPDVIVDVPEAYEPSFVLGQSRFHSVEDLQRAMDEALYVHPDQLDIEQTKVGIRLSDDPEAFLDAHNGLVAEFGKEVAGLYPEAAERTVRAIADYMGRGDELAANQWAEMLSARTEGLSGVFALDHISESGLGSMRPYTRSIAVSSILSLIDSETAHSMISEAILPHEAIHLISASAYVPEGKSMPLGPVNLPMRTGLATNHRISSADGYEALSIVRSGDWVNEAETEDLRSRAMHTNELNYVRGVAVLRAMKRYDPTMEHALDEALLGARGPGEAIGKIENILGPTGIEYLAPYISARVWDAEQNKAVMKYDDETFISVVASTVPPGIANDVEQAIRQEMDTIVVLNRHLPPYTASLAKSPNMH